LLLISVRCYPLRKHLSHVLNRDHLSEAD
jgi:hypothetical protein